MSSSTGPEDVMRVRELLLSLRISRSKLYRMLDPASPSHDARMPRPFKIGSSTYFLTQEVNSWIRQCVESSRGCN
jgi:predicted DNA-binding transcriptional regulator AlpA